MEASIIIGLGTSGLKILEYCQQFLYEAYGANLVERTEEAGIKLINIETDEGVPVRETPAGSIITKINATVQDMGNSYEVLKRKNKVDVSWMPPNLDSSLESMGITAGAGGWRAVGRFALWNPDNFDEIYKTLASAYNDVTDKGRTNIFTVGTLMGGTCSGMLIDMGYLLRDISNNKAQNNVGLFLVPAATGLGTETHRQCANTWASLKDLTFYNDKDNVYDCHWPNGVQPNSGKFPPYKECFLLSSQYETNAPGFAPLNLDHLYYLCGFYLFSNICGMRSKIDALRVDDYGGKPFYTFGLSGFSYPKYGITELVGTELAEEHCSRMIDTKEYWAEEIGELVHIDETEIERDAEKFISNLVARCVEQYDSWSEGNLPSFVDEQVRLWENGNLKTEEIRNQFKHSPGNKTNARARMNAKANSVRDFVIESISNETQRVLETYQNIPYVRNFITSLASHRDKLLNLWAQQGVDSGVMKALNAAIDAVSVTKRGVFDLDREGRNEAVILSFADRVKLSLMYSVFSEIDFDKGTTLFKGSPLLSFSELSAMNKGLTSDAGVLKTLSRHKHSLESILSDPHLPLRMIWKNSTLAKEREHFLAIVQNRPGDMLQRHNTNGGLLGFLRDIQIEKGEMRHKYAWSDLVSAFQGVVESSVTSELGNIDLIDLVNAQNIHVSAQAKKAEYVLLPLKVGGNRKGTSPGVPSFTAGNSTAALNKLRGNIKGCADLCHIEELQNTVIFYQEQTHIAPMTDLINSDKLKELREKVANPEASESAVFNDEKWNKLLDPYQVEERISEPRTNILKDVLMLGVMEWVVGARSGELEPNGVNVPAFTWNENTSGGKLSITGGSAIYLDGKTYPTLETNLTQMLRSSPQFFEEAQQTLASLGSIPVTTLMQDRWDNLKMTQEECATLQNRLANLGTMTAEL